MTRARAMTITTLILGGLGALIFLYWACYARFYEYTDDAYVDGNKVILTPQVSGIVTQITADAPDFVSEGRPLVELDTQDAMVALSTALADLGQTVRHVLQLFQKVPELSAVIEHRKAVFVKTAQDFDHREELIAEAAVSLEDLEHATSALRSSFADLLMAENQYIAALEEVDNTTIDTHPLVIASQERVKQAYLNLQRCQILSPATGLVSQRRVQVGQQVAKGDALLSIVPLDQMWITANFKEIQLKNVRIGQPVKVHVDLWGDLVTFHGKVIGIGGGTGSVFSVLPPQNATGNWIKIVQRLPVRIELDPQQIKRFPLRLGLSCEATIDLHDISDAMIPQEKPLKPLYQTMITAEQMQGVDLLIAEVMQENISSIFKESSDDMP